MRMNSLIFIGLLALAIAPLFGQPVNQNGPIYWTKSQPNCAGLANGGVTTVLNGPATVGYACYVTGTFVWLAAGGVAGNPAHWSSAIRVAAPSSAPIGVEYSFFTVEGNTQRLDATVNGGSSVQSGTSAGFALAANQPLEVELLGESRDAPAYANTATGSVNAKFLCPDENTCANVLPQLIYSALPTYPWSLSVPIAWRGELSSQWSAEGIDDGLTNVVSLVIYNGDTQSAAFNVFVYDSNGNLAGSGTTPTIQSEQFTGTGEGGTYGVLLSQVVSPLPSGIFKILIDGPSRSAVEVLQVNGPSATTLQVSPDSAPASQTARAVRYRGVNKPEIAPSQVLPPVPK